MILLYQLSIRLYALAIRIAANFNPKAKKFLDGRKDIFRRIELGIDGLENIIWVHAASLGEFEQGKPIIEGVKAARPHVNIVLTFFSPSGYEVRKNYEGADFVTYLPLDGPNTARKFIGIVKPTYVVFIKYEFWYFYLRELNQRKIPLIMVSSIFRRSQMFFHWSGKFYHKVLKPIDHYFVQDENSKNLISEISPNVTVSGDTRFDRVLDIAKNKKEIEIAAHFVGDKKGFVLGSVWNHDIDFLTPFIKKNQAEYRFIIAPHNLNEKELENIESKLEKTVRYSKYHEADYEVLIIDNIGMLSSLYQYASYVYVGGSFNKGLHNTLEAAVYGVPIFIGGHPKNEKYREARELRSAGALFEFYHLNELEKKFLELEGDDEEYTKTSKSASEYVVANGGATRTVLDYILDRI